MKLGTSFYKTKLTILLAATISVLSACNKDRICIKGKGPLITKTRALTDFNSLEMEMDANVIWHYDSVYRCEVEAQENLFEFLEIETKGMTLCIQKKRLTTIRKSLPITFHVYSPKAEGVSVSGSGSVQLEKGLQVVDLSINISGSGNVSSKCAIENSVDVNISGSGKLDLSSNQVCAKAKYKMSGSGDLNAFGFVTKQVDANISGSASMKIYVTEHLDANISGSGKIIYKGNPKVNSKISGSGKVEGF